MLKDLSDLGSGLHVDDAGTSEIRLSFAIVQQKVPLIRQSGESGSRMP